MTDGSLLHSFYSAFQAGDSKKMTSFYDNESSFEDPAFGKLDSQEVKAMWEMLIQRGGKDLKIEFEVLEETAQAGKVKWQAYYVFSKTKRPVHNIIHASFRIADGKIIEHIDKFDFYRWSKQALGTTGMLLGWTPLLRKKVRKMSKQALSNFMNTKSN